MGWSNSLQQMPLLEQRCCLIRLPLGQGPAPAQQVLADIDYWLIGIVAPGQGVFVTILSGICGV
jgi:hypothetical protein